MKNRILFLITAVVFCTYSCSNSNETAISESAKADSILMANAKSIFGTLPESAFIDTVQMSEAKVKLGKILYFDKRLSKDETQSCNTCHNLATYGVDNLATSKGDNGGFGTRNSPTTFNAALHAFQFWDGRMKDVEEQAGGPILNPVEMAIPNEKFLVDRISKIPMYQELFKAAYPNDAKPIVYKNIQNAIGHFERTLITPTRFDNFLNGDMAALTAEEKKGLETFNKAGCIACHNGPILGGNSFQKFGVFASYESMTKSSKIDNGRFDVTKSDADKFLFKTPALTNIEKTGPYFHDGSVASLEESIKIMGKLELNKELTEVEVTEITAFLKALTAQLNKETISEPVELTVK